MDQCVLRIISSVAEIVSRRSPGPFRMSSSTLESGLAPDHRKGRRCQLILG